MHALATASWNLPELLGASVPWLVLLTVGWIATSEGRAKTARQRILARPGLLVPAAMAVVGLVVIHAALDAVAVLETPAVFDRGPPATDDSRGRVGPWPWIGFGLVALTLAGHVGILEADRAGRPPNGFDFVHGVRRHGLTFLIGKFVLLVAVLSLARNVPMRGPAILLLLLPNVLLAPLPGIASRHPGRPIAALFATVPHALQNVQTVGFRVTLLAGFVLASKFAAARVLDIAAPDRLLASSVSSLSWNPYPWLQWAGSTPAMFAIVAGSAFVSTVMVTAQWIAVVEPQGEPVHDPRTPAAA